jgi:bis(5'-nucleosyl)-tetraphosphatase (symmetrical)
MCTTKDTGSLLAGRARACKPVLKPYPGGQYRHPFAQQVIPARAGIQEWLINHWRQPSPPNIETYPPPSPLNTTHPMETYAIGDLQGCAADLESLLSRIDRQSPNAQLIFVGDLVNRGPESLRTLRMVRALGKRALTILGNHDLHLLAIACGARARGRMDTMQEILGAPDCDALLTWLRQQPLALLVQDHLIVHAGVLPQWTAAQVVALSDEVTTQLRGPHWQDFLRTMYGNTPLRWTDALQGEERMRCIVNGLTRLRFCTANGDMEFETKEGPGNPPVGHLPWFDVPNRKTADVTVVFGHWSTLGLIQRPRLLGIDSGCVWGGKLTAVRLRDRQLVQVDCPQYQDPG